MGVRCWVRVGSILLAVLGLAACFALNAYAQTEAATIRGSVTDSSGAVVLNAAVRLVDIDRGTKTEVQTGSSGFYSFASVAPGRYRMEVEKSGFRLIHLTGITANVQDNLEENFKLDVGAVSESITVEANALNVNTTDATVSTVIDRKFVESLPLNGRSFNTLLQLTPGVVIAQSTPSSRGQFSVAGQRTSSNNFLVDGVSANFGVAPTFGLGATGTGSAQAFSALGGTSSLVSVEALQEFRIETSSFSAEFGRSPGGQVILSTRSGTNEVHGGIYEYFRNDVLDANDWFANSVGKPRAPERHNDFGGFAGGPIQKDKTFFFLSYEGARLRQPSTRIVQVPSGYARSVASSALAPFVDAYPQPDDGTIVPGVYVSQFTGNFSNPSTLNAGSVRIDRTFNSKFSLFGRYSDSPSQSANRSQSLNEVDTTEVGTRTLTLSATMTITPQTSNALRGNYSVQSASFVSKLDSFGGAVPPSLAVMAPNLPDPGDASLSFYSFDTGFYGSGPSSRNRSTQWNLADDLSANRGVHQLKFGADYRAIVLNVHPYLRSLGYLASSISNFLTTGQASIVGEVAEPSRFLAQASSIYGQDTWKVTPKLVLTYGVRWELSPAPTARKGTTLAAWTNVNDPASLALAPPGTDLWKTTYGAFAPRFGAAYRLTREGDLVLRGGWGLFYDLASDTVGYLATGFPNDAFNCCVVASLPITDSLSYIPSFSLSAPYPNGAMGFDPHLKLPRSQQWNVALEKTFLGQQAVSVTYVGQAGRDLLRQEGIDQPNANFSGAFLLTQNTARSNYNALQAQYRRPVAGRVQTLLNYTWSHSLDNASNDSVAAISSTVFSRAKDYASSDSDIRHSFSGALTYAVPAITKAKVLAALTSDWSIETLAVARTGFPFNATAVTQIIGDVYPRPDRVPGQPVWIPNPSAGGGKSLNPAAFSIPSTVRQGTEGRNDIAGFGLTEVDLSIGRKFPIQERFKLQFRADAFNLLNHPNFANPYGYVPFAAYLKSPYMSNHGLGGLNSLFQEGGPRSLQLSLKLSF